MKYFRSLFALLFLLSVLPLMAAGKPTDAGSSALQFTVSSYNTFPSAITPNPVELSWQHFVADRQAIRLGATLAVANHIDTTSFLLQAGFMHYFAPVGPVSLYLGGTLGFGDVYKNFDLQPQANLGVEYWFQPHISFAAEYSMGLNFLFANQTIVNFGVGTTALKVNYYF